MKGNVSKGGIFINNTLSTYLSRISNFNVETFDLTSFDNYKIKEGLYPFPIGLNDYDRVNGYKLLKLMIRGKRDFVYYSKEINRYMSNTSLEMVVDNNRAELVNHFINKNSEVLVNFLLVKIWQSTNESKSFFNDEKLCLSVDINPLNRKIYVHKGCYFDSFLTNIICGVPHELYNSSELVATTSKLIPTELGENNTYEYKPYIHSSMNNQIGVSTIAITKDNYLLILRQNEMNQSSEGLLVPSGSGSLDWSDKFSSNFDEVIKHGMERELTEECNCNVNFIYYTKLIGFFKWGKKGCQPQFLGVTKLNKNLSEIKPDTKEVDKGLFVKIQNINHLNQEINRLLEYNDLSVPLIMGLYFLNLYVETHSEEAKLLL